MAPFNKEDVRKATRQLIQDILTKKKSKAKPEDIVEGVSLVAQLGIDSLDILQIMAIVEKKYGLSIPDEELKDMDDLGGILKAVEKHWPKEG